MIKFRPRRITTEITPMHSHDRTLLSKLGFADVDKGNERHDLACLYLTDEKRLADLLEIKEPEDCQVDVERHLCKGSGPYKSTIGFLDVSGTIWSGRCRTAFVIEVKINPVPFGDVLRQLNLYKEYYNPFPPGSGLATRSDCDNDAVTYVRRWALVTDFDLSDRAIDAFEREGIIHARLGPAFDAWVNAKSKRKARKML